jgi:DNA-binding MarR family transcriptional regulator
VSRTRNPANRRTHVLSLTAAGGRALDEMPDAVSTRDERITAALSGRERKRLT